MRNLTKYVLFCGSVILCLWAEVCHGFYYPLTNLDENCGRTIQMGCPWSFINKNERAGTFRFRRVPESNCTITLVIRTSSVSACHYTPTLYFNFRQVRLPDNATLDIYTSRSNWADGPVFPRTLVKHIPGGRLHHNRDPSSVAQLKARFEYSTSELTIQYVGDGTSAPHHELLIDYAVLTDDNNSNEEWCSALGAYVLKDVACDEDDRVTCPYDYYDAVGLNPTTGFGACGLGAGAIAGIVIGSVFGAAFLCGICATCCSNSKKPPVMTGFSNTVSSPVVVSGYTPAEATTIGAPPIVPFKDDPPPYPADGIFAPLPYPEQLPQYQNEPPKY